jgi:hypothetical protein
VITITQQLQYLNYRVGLRTNTYDWDTVFTCIGATVFTLTMPTGNYIASVASVDTNGVESLFSKELMLSIVTGKKNHDVSGQNIELLQNKPNPADEATTIAILLNKHFSYKSAFISITDLQGKEVKKLPVVLKEGINEVEYDHGYHVNGTFIYSLIVDGKVVQSKKMVFAN